MKCSFQSDRPKVAGANADYAFGSAFAVDRFGGEAQLFSLGSMTRL